MVAALIFEARIAAGECHRRVVVRALLFGTLAYGVSAAAAPLLGSGGEEAFFSGLPLLDALRNGACLPVPHRHAVNLHS